MPAKHSLTVDAPAPDDVDIFWALMRKHPSDTNRQIADRFQKRYRLPSMVDVQTDDKIMDKLQNMQRPEGRSWEKVADRARRES